MSKLEQLKGELQPLFERFSDDNLASIEDVCLKYLLEQTSLVKPSSATTDSGIYLLQKLAGEIRQLLEADEPLREERFRTLEWKAWEPFKKFVNVLLSEPQSDVMLRSFQETLRSIALLT
jgi:hypothetical protein